LLIFNFIVLQTELVIIVIILIIIIIILITIILIIIIIYYYSNNNKYYIIIILYYKQRNNFFFIIHFVPFITFTRNQINFTWSLETFCCWTTACSRIGNGSETKVQIRMTRWQFLKIATKNTHNLMQRYLSSLIN